MDLLPKLALFAAIRLFPDMLLTGRGLQIRASDNVEMLRALARDPMVLKGARVDTMYGLVDLMDDALGAAPRDVVRLIVRRGITLALVGTAAGLLLAAAASRALGSLLFTVTPRDPITLAAGATLVLAAAFAASWIPARRAARISPTIAMRE